MNVQFCYELRENIGTYRVKKKVMTVKEAEKLKDQYLDDKIYGRVWLRYFDGWHYRVVKILKER